MTKKLFEPAAEEYLIKPVRRHNRRLHKNAILKGGYRKANQVIGLV